MKQRHRIFIAINLPADIRKVMAGYQKQWQDVPAKWTALDNIHITLVFLGEATDQELGEVCLTVKEIAKHHDSFNISLHKIAYGPATAAGGVPSEGGKEKIPRYIWAGGETSKELSQLKKDLEDALSEKVKFALDNKPFAPHITLARIKEWEWRAIEPEERPEVNEDIELTFSVESIDVMESELTRQGPRYVIIESHQLQ